MSGLPSEEHVGSPRRRSGWGLTILRTVVCLAAVVWLVYNVPWNDHVKLADEAGTRVRLLEEREDGLVVLRDGVRETIGYDAVRHLEVEGRRIPDIELGIPSVVLRLDKQLALLAIALFMPVWFLQSYRLVLMVAIQGVKLSYWKAVQLTFAGNFFNFALPGTTGGDLVKAYYITRFTRLKTEVVTTVFLDRAIGLFSVVLIATTGIVLKWDPVQFGYLVWVLVLIFASLIVGAVVVFSKRVRSALRLSRIVERLPLGHQILRIGRATVAMRQHKMKVIGALALSLTLQSIVMVSAAVMAWALGMEGDLGYYFIYVAIGFLIAAIPISPPQALGVMEFAYVRFFTATLNNTASQALALAIGVRLIQLVWALPGVLVPLLGAHLPSKAELAALEAEAAAEDEAAEREAEGVPGRLRPTEPAT
jgi:uncharacterized protein (TIRG00374 family)